MASTRLRQTLFGRTYPSTMLSHIADNLEQLEEESIELLNAELFRKIVSSSNVNCCSEILSRQVAAFFRSHPGDTDGCIVQSLTACERMPSIDPDMASVFLKLDSDYPSQADGQSGPTLRQRSLAALSKDWTSVLAGDGCEDFSRLTLQQKYEVTQQALRSADSKIDELRDSIERITGFLVEGSCEGHLEQKMSEFLSSPACTREALFPLTTDYGYVRRNKGAFPDVMVSGAGFLPANGTYTLFDAINGVGAYKHGNFYLCRMTSQNAKRWELVFCGVPLYWSDWSLEECEHPLDQRWFAVGNIGGQVPTMKHAQCPL